MSFPQIERYNVPNTLTHPIPRLDWKSYHKHINAFYGIALSSQAYRSNDGPVQLSEILTPFPS